MHTIDEQRFLNVPKLYKMKPQPRKAYSINRDGQLVQANGFKQPEPTVSMNKPNLWMHSIERTDAANPIQGFVIFGVMIVLVGLVLVFVR